jgi:hypothetical protein
MILHLLRRSGRGLVGAAAVALLGPSAALAFAGFVLPASGGAVGSARRGLCPVSHVRYGPDPAAAGGLRSIPWITTAPGSTFHAYLFYYGATPWPRERRVGARIFTTVKARNVNPKVLWVPQKRGAGRTISISGARLDADGRFSSRYLRASGNQFPSYVEVPAAGCWRVTVRTGQLVGKVTFIAVDTY